MPRIHVCSLRALPEAARATGASQVLTVMKNIAQVATPDGIAPKRHLRLEFADIVAPREGETLASAEQVAEILAFARAWDRRAPLLIHCFAGVSRSTASAFMAACALRPDIEEQEWAMRLRHASPTATPNLHLVRLADAQLGREGRMIAAIEAIGRGTDCFEGVPFHLEIGPD